MCVDLVEMGRYKETEKNPPKYQENKILKRYPIRMEGKPTGVNAIDNYKDLRKLPHLFPDDFSC